ncbi:unnamed protein product [Caenorhabditis angaria]|uniref:ShKT domain-containing protein n=1 Tax=Caenorhabditis angaria TaxID=860376 RepID=A0A9P1IJL1_9PELO|nr:unnamed protein product [Caenorhabditis angaria]
MKILLLILVSSVLSEDCTTNKKETKCTSIFDDLQNCYNSTYKPMLGDCLVTCNACDSYTCTNPQPDTTLNCTALIAQCDSPTFGEFMKEKCPQTCGKCNRKNANLCSNRSEAEVCTAMSPFCNTVDFYDLLTTQCPSTCNRCLLNGTTTHGGSGSGEGGGGTDGKCVDLAADCGANHSKCSNAQYAPLMHRLCPQTCNSCSTCEDYNKM